MLLLFSIMTTSLMTTSLRKSFSFGLLCVCISRELNQSVYAFLSLLLFRWMLDSVVLLPGPGWSKLTTSLVNVLLKF